MPAAELLLGMQRFGWREPVRAKAKRALAAVGAWLQLALAVYLKSKRWTDAAGVLQTLIAQHPRPPYWLQLSAVYGELEDYETALAVMALVVPVVAGLLATLAVRRSPEVRRRTT